jgi:hypothetical protein
VLRENIGNRRRVYLDSVPDLSEALQVIRVSLLAEFGSKQIDARRQRATVLTDFGRFAMPFNFIGENALSPWQVRVIIGFIATVPLVLACTLFATDSNFWRDLVKDFGVVIAGLLVVNLVWSIVGGEPLENAIKVLRHELQRTEVNLGRFSKLTSSAQAAGLLDVGGNSSALQYQADQLVQMIEHAKVRICVCGLTLLLLQENHNLVTVLREAANRGVLVQILLAAHDNPWLAASNEEATLPGMTGVISNTIRILKEAAQNTQFQVRALRKKTFTVSLLRFDETIIATPYLVSTMTASSPRFVASGSDTPLFKIWMREFDYLFEVAEPV